MAAGTHRPSKQKPEVREFLLRNVDRHPDDIATLAAQEFRLSRSAINNYLKRLIDEHVLTATGKTNSRRYELTTLSRNEKTVPLANGTAEDRVWRMEIAPYMKDVKENVVNICHYGFTEIFNNAIEHSGSPSTFVSYKQSYASIEMVVADFGVGIFEKIKRDLDYPDSLTALLELSKGKLTTDAKHHSGEGIFFASRMFDRFVITSGDIAYASVRNDEWGWLVESEDLIESVKGTQVLMQISTAADWTAKEIFRRYEGEAVDENVRPFARTHVPVKLGKYGNEQLVSRSQAKRILARFDRFSEVYLDFQGVLEIGQAFADEIFRVFSDEHPNVKLVAVNMSPDVESMIARARARGAEMKNSS